MPDIVLFEATALLIITNYHKHTKQGNGYRWPVTIFCPWVTGSSISSGLGWPHLPLLCARLWYETLIRFGQILVAGLGLSWFVFPDSRTTTTPASDKSSNLKPTACLKSPGPTARLLSVTRKISFSAAKANLIPSSAMILVRQWDVTLLTATMQH